MDTWDCPTHGELHPGNVLVETASQGAWLIDFGRAGPGHWARDFAELELAVRFQIADPPTADDLFVVESGFIDVAALHEAIDTSGTLTGSARRSAEIVEAIRQQAGLAGAQLLESDERALEEYAVALFAMGLNYFRLHRLIRSAPRKRQVQMALALLRERVDSIQRLWAAAPQA